MLVVMQSHATEPQIRAVCERIESLGLKAHPIPGALRTAIGITGNKGALDLGVLESLTGVIECIPVSKPYKLVSRDVKEEDTILRIATPSGDVLFGGIPFAPLLGLEHARQHGGNLFGTADLSNRRHGRAADLGVVVDGSCHEGGQGVRGTPRGEYLDQRGFHGRRRGS